MLAIATLVLTMAMAAKAVSDDPRSLAVPNPEVDPDPTDDGGLAEELAAYERELRRAADKYGSPPGGKQLTKLPDLWVDRDAARVYVDGYVTMRRGPLEMFACPIGSKEHESIVAVFATSSEVHAALLAIGAESGTPVAWDPEFAPPTGQSIAVWVTWRNAEGQFQIADARTWLHNTADNTSLDRWWVFAGSRLWTDPADGTEHYSADGGDMICVSNFSTAMLDVPFDSSAQAGNLLFTPFTDRIPEERTPVRLVLAPLSASEEAQPETLKPPTETILPPPDAVAADAKPATQGDLVPKTPAAPLRPPISLAPDSSATPLVKPQP